MKASNSKRIIFAMMICAFLAMADDAKADICQAELILQHANELNCAGDEMREEIKTHFRKTRYYGKLLATNALIRGRAAAVERRIKRNPAYRRLCRDVEKLEKLTCELNSIYNETIFRMQQGKGRPICEDTCHVLDLIRNMQEISNCMVAMAKGEVIVVEELVIQRASPVIQVPQPVFRFSEIVPNHQVAPGVSGTIETLNPTGVQMNRPVVNEPHSVLRSVLEK